MRTFKATAFLAVAALVMGAGPAMAVSYAPTGANPHNIPGTTSSAFTASGFGLNYNCGLTTFNHNFTATGSTSLPGSVLVTNSGSQPCDSTSGTFDTFNTIPISLTQIRVANINFNAPFGLCSRSNVNLPWANGAVNSTITVSSPISIGACSLNTLNLTVERVTIV